MYPDLRISRSTPQCAVIDIEGTIGADLETVASPQAPVSTYRRFREKLDRLAALRAPEVVVNIRSTGGSLADAFLIYEALCSLDATVTTRCWGYTASAATVIAQAASPRRREISANCLYLIHCSESAAEGNHAELERSLDLLRQTDRRIADLYATRSGRPADEFLTLMARGGGRGCWLSPEETLRAGLADRIIRTEQNVSNKLNMGAGGSEPPGSSVPYTKPPDWPALPRVGFFRRYAANLRAALNQRLAESLHVPLRYTPVVQPDPPVPPDTDTSESTMQQPDMPNVTETGSDPAVPETGAPEVPGVSEVPGAPGAPEVPGASEASGAPEVPGASEAPEVPEPAASVSRDCRSAASGSADVSGVEVQGNAGDSGTVAETVRSTVRATATRCKEDPSPADNPQGSPNEDAYRADASRLRTSF